MIKQLKKWWQTQKDITKKTAGLAEKEASVKRKYEAAMSILNQRKKDVPVKVDRRKSDQFDLKLA